MRMLQMEAMTMGTAKACFSEEDIKSIEQMVRDGEVDAARSYTDDAMRCHANDMDELHRRRMILARVDSDIVTQTECFGLLSALMDDRKGWDLALERIGDNVDPGFGFLAWRCISAFSANQKLANEWFFAVEQSALNGHGPARREVLKNQLQAAGFVSRVMIRWKLAKLETELVNLATDNPDDRRLADYK